MQRGFVGLIGARIDSLGLDYKVVNAGLSGETSAGGNSRIDWILRQKIDVFVLELGANDGLRGTAISETYKNLNSILQKVKTKYPEAKILICAMEALPNMGEKFTSEFRGIFADLAKMANRKLRSQSQTGSLRKVDPQRKWKSQNCELKIVAELFRNAHL